MHSYVILSYFSLFRKHLNDIIHLFFISIEKTLNLKAYRNFEFEWRLFCNAKYWRFIPNHSDVSNECVKTIVSIILLSSSLRKPRSSQGRTSDVIVREASEVEVSSGESALSFLTIKSTDCTDLTTSDIKCTCTIIYS